MNKKVLFVLITLAILNLNAQESIMTYNIRYNNPNDGENWWENRKQELADMILKYHPDILGIQEGLDNQVKYLDATLNNYSFVGVGRDDGLTKGEYSAIFFNKNNIKLLETKTYWLSETPSKVSIGWDASMERIVTYGKFKNKSTNKIIHVFNCHYDHIGEKSRENSSNLILKLIKNKKIENDRIVVIGDLNSLPNDKPIAILKTKLKDSYKISKSKPKGSIGTFNGFNSKEAIIDRIDYIFVSNLVVNQYTTIEDKRKNNLMLSDHMPVLVKLN